MDYDPPTSPMVVAFFAVFGLALALIALFVYRHAHRWQRLRRRRIGKWRSVGRSVPHWLAELGFDERLERADGSLYRGRFGGFDVIIEHFGRREGASIHLLIESADKQLPRNLEFSRREGDVRRETSIGDANFDHDVIVAGDLDEVALHLRASARPAIREAVRLGWELARGGALDVRVPEVKDVESYLACGLAAARVLANDKPGLLLITALYDSSLRMRRRALASFVARHGVNALGERGRELIAGGDPILSRVARGDERLSVLIGDPSLAHDACEVLGWIGGANDLPALAELAARASDKTLRGLAKGTLARVRARAISNAGALALSDTSGGELAAPPEE
jgi:hypothetical protein